MAIVFLAPTEAYLAALGPNSLSHREPHHPTVKENILVLTSFQDVSLAQW